MKKSGCLIAIGCCLVLCFGGCSGFLFWGYSLNVQDARRDYAAAEQLWSSGDKARAVETYKKINALFLGKDEEAEVKQRLHDFAVEQTKHEVEAADQEWAAGDKDAAAARYRTIDLALLDPTEQETVKQRVREVDLATAAKDLETADRLWLSGDTTAAAAKYGALPLDLLDAPSQERVTSRLYETANHQWDEGRKGTAAACYKRLRQDLLAQTERDVIAQRVKESDATDRKYTNAESTSLGKRVQLTAIELYYTSTITAAEARRLGDFLEKTFTDPDHKGTVQIAKQGKTYQVRVVVKKGIEMDEEAVPLYKALAVQISVLVFDGAEVEIHLCDDRLKTLRVVIPLAKP